MPEDTPGVTVIGGNVVGTSGGVTQLTMPRAQRVVSATDPSRFSLAPGAPTQAQTSPITIVPSDTTQTTDTTKSVSRSTVTKTALGAVAVLKGVAEINNAKSAYRALKGQAQLNIMMAQNQAADAVYRGKQLALDRQAEGVQAGQQSLLAAAAQGQDVAGAGAQKIQQSFEAMGVYNAMREEINSIREAMGFELEEVGLEFQIAQGEIARDSAIANAYLNTGVGLLGAAAGVGL